MLHLVWGIQDDSDEDNMIDQIRRRLPDSGTDETLRRKIYRQRVADVITWEDINQEKIAIFPMNMIPQKAAKMDQVFNNSLNDSWNEPTIIKVFIVNEENCPEKFDFIYDAFTIESSVISTKVTITSRIKHSDLTFNWQFGIDLIQVQNFKQSWLHMIRSVY